MYHHSFNTKLPDRTLWYDGCSSVSVDKLLQLIEQGISTEKLCVEEITKDIEQYNNLVPKNEAIQTKDTCNKLSFDWNIPAEYKSLDVYEFLVDKLADECALCSSEDSKKRVDRLIEEFKLYKDLKLIKVLQAIIYVINTLTINNIVWGVGRGSSVSSYILYLIGVHDVDSVKYELNIKDFLN